MTFAERINVYIRDTTREVKRVTLPSYYRAVRVNSYKRPVWACSHKHGSRNMAFRCFVESNKAYFGEYYASVRLWVIANCKG